MIYVKNYPQIDVNTDEIMRYGKGTDESMISQMLSVCQPSLSYKVCYGVFDVKNEGDALHIGSARIDSRALLKNLCGCDRVIIFGATIGIGFDRLIQKYSVLSPSKAYALYAIGAERIESLCDAFCKDMEYEFAKEERYLRPRFSAGYGDLDLTVQRDIFSMLDAPRKIGLTLTDSLMMSPSKSVTAFVGVSDKPFYEVHKCASCDKTDCVYRS